MKPSQRNRRRSLARFGRCQASCGFTLLEVILALAILGGSLAMLGEVWRLAGRNASDAAAETRAQILAESLMDEALVGVPTIKEGVRQPLPDFENEPTRWLYTMRLNAAPVEGLQLLEIVVEQDLEPHLNPVKFRIVRWTPSEAEVDESQEEVQAVQDAAGSAGT